MNRRNRLSARKDEAEALRLQLEPVFDEYARAITALEKRIKSLEDNGPELIRDTIGEALIGGAGCTVIVDDAADTITITVP